MARLIQIPDNAVESVRILAKAAADVAAGDGVSNKIVDGGHRCPRPHIHSTIFPGSVSA